MPDRDRIERLKAKHHARALLNEFPGVSSYQSVLRMVETYGVVYARKKLGQWQRDGSTAPRRG